jgi:hypothetical protein
MNTDDFCDLAVNSILTVKPLLRLMQNRQQFYREKPPHLAEFRYSGILSAGGVVNQRVSTVRILHTTTDRIAPTAYEYSRRGCLDPTSTILYLTRRKAHKSTAQSVSEQNSRFRFLLRSRCLSHWQRLNFAVVFSGSYEPI